MIVTDCYMDLTKRTKIMGLTTTSLLILIVVLAVSWFALLLYSLAIVAIVWFVLFLMEFFDEDIYDIISSKMKIKQNKFYA